MFCGYDREQFQKSVQKTQRRIEGSHIGSQDLRKDEVDVLLESTIVSERSQWDQRDSTYMYPSKYVCTV